MPTTGRRRRPARSALVIATGLACATGALTARPSAAAAHPGWATGRPVPAVRPVPSVTTLARTGTPLPTWKCVDWFAIHCYTPGQYRRAYGLGGLYSQGITGRGRTIVVVDSFGSPTIRADLGVFDRQFGIHDPNLWIIRSGKIPPFDPNDPAMLSWAAETTLDVEYAHAVAPDARIVLLETPVAETEGVTGFPEMMRAEQALINRGIGDVISQSFGATENTFPGFARGDYSSLGDLRYAFAGARAHRVTVLAASGDFGATDAELDGQTLYPFPVSSWPSTDPLVTAVGGARLSLDNTGSRIGPDVAWNDGFGAAGGGRSAVFSRPAFQDGVRGVVGGRRGTPDISMSGSVDGGCWVYQSFSPSGGGWDVLGGTSEATPLFAGIVALADQVAGHRLGDINPALYRLGELSHVPHAGIKTGIVDITAGNNSFAGITGFSAASGYDLASGWGTIDAADFVRALAQL